jgi:hypothetical protein
MLLRDFKVRFHSRDIDGVRAVHLQTVIAFGSIFAESYDEAATAITNESLKTENGFFDSVQEKFLLKRLRKCAFFAPRGKLYKH